MKTVTILVNTSNLMRAAEIANITLTSPAGNTITLYKKHLSNIPQSMIDLFWKCAGTNQIELTIEEMKLALKFSEIPFWGYEQQLRADNMWS